MNMSLRVLIFIVSILIATVVLVTLKKGRMPLKYSLVWLMPITLFFLLSIVPDAVWSLTKMVGFETTSNFVIGILFLILFYICISLTIIVSGQRTKISLLIQEISMLKEKINKK